MDLKSSIAYLLRDGKGMNKNAILEITKSVFGAKEKELLKALEEMLQKKELSLENDLIKATARSRRRIRRTEKTNYKIPLWHRRWTMIVFHIAEDDKQLRDQIRYQLKKEGFAVFKNSIWISPHPLSDSLRRYIENHGLSNEVKVFYGILSSNDEAELIKTIWNAKSIERKYQDFIKEAKRQFKRLKTMRLEEELRNKALDLLAKITEIKYLSISEIDPKLPRPFLSKNWPGFHAFRIYQQLGKYLQS